MTDLPIQPSAAAIILGVSLRQVYDLAAYYFDDSVLMFRWLADKIESYKSSGDFLISG